MTETRKPPTPSRKAQLEGDLVKIGKELANYKQGIDPRAGIVFQPAALVDLLIDKGLIDKLDLDIRVLEKIKENATAGLISLEEAKNPKKKLYVPGREGLREV